MEPIHDREDCGTDVATRSRNFVNAQQIFRAPSRSTASDFAFARDVFIVRLPIAVSNNLEVLVLRPLLESHHFECSHLVRVDRIWNC